MFVFAFVFVRFVLIICYFISMVFEVWLNVFVIHIVDNRFWLALPVYVGMELTKPL
jgi:hypothetical protein